MNIDLNEREQATLIGVLIEVIETSQLARSPRLELPTPPIDERSL